mmetsp:Transcript_72316/g.223444  ORF Transcript_72316/g.223444 Transcript_72316/m.223444 type:complete len:525 (+) Transcript_72316:224-1798(+)
MEKQSQRCQSRTSSFPAPLRRHPQGPSQRQTAHASRAPPAALARALLLLGFGCARAAAATSWTLSDAYVGTDFFSKWNFFTQADPTHGAVKYVDYQTALAEGLISATADRVYMAADKAAGLAGRGRHSVRIESAAIFNEGLFVVTLDHIPTGCGTWSAFWMFGEDAAHHWPAWGEYDIIEGVHTANRMSTALHTTMGCDQSSVQADWNPGRSKPADNCYVAAQGQQSNQGCSQRGPPNSFGPGFNNHGGGTFAAEWDPVGEQIRTWFWPAGGEPADLLQKRPRPDFWGAPFSQFTLLRSACPSSHFKNMRLVFDITLCGDLGNPTFKEFCPVEASRMTCEDLVAAQPLPEAYWSVRTLDVYGRGAAAAVLPWTRIIFAVVAVIATVGATVLIVRHTRRPIAPSGLAPPGRGQGDAKVNLLRKVGQAPAVPFKWRALATSPVGGAPGDEPLELVWESGFESKAAAEAMTPVPNWRHGSPSPSAPALSNVVTRDSIAEDLNRFSVELDQSRPHRSPWSCGCCRQNL